jgi:uncharacterized membrane protein
MNKKTGFQLYYSRIFFLRNEMDRLLSISILFSCLMALARIIYTGGLTFVSLVWNLFLAIVPYFITQQLQRKPKLVQKKLVFTFFFLLWLVCIPNSFYIITDLFHLGDQRNDYLAPQWYDLALILSFAWNGLLLGILSVRQMEKVTEKFFPGRHELFFLVPVMVLNALGVFVGRYLRFNTWDIITNPFLLCRDIGNILLHPVTYRYAWGMIVCFSILMTLMYMTIKKISKGIH